MPDLHPDIDEVDAYYVVLQRAVGTKKSGLGPWTPFWSRADLDGTATYPQHIADIWNAKWSKPRSRNRQEYAVFKIPTSCMEQLPPPENAQ